MMPAPRDVARIDERGPSRSDAGRPVWRSVDEPVMLPPLRDAADADGRHQAPARTERFRVEVVVQPRGPTGECSIADRDAEWRHAGCLQHASAVRRLRPPCASRRVSAPGSTNLNPACTCRAEAPLPERDARKRSPMR